MCVVANKIIFATIFDILREDVQIEQTRLSQQFLSMYDTKVPIET